jgi:ABC-type transport system involved in multi-copper enzyme maturation permease subunit
VNPTIALQMIGADFLKIRKKPSTLAFALVFACLPLIIFFTVRAAQHSSNPIRYEPAGGISGFTDGVRLLALFMGPLAAILIGAEAGAGDPAGGVFRDLVVTGRSRVALFASRVPAALALCWSVIGVGYVIMLAGTFVFASNAPTPDGAMILNGLAFSLLATGVVCAVAVGLASLIGSRPGAITALIGWQLVASPLIASISSLGSVRDIILSQGLAHFSPVHLGDRAAQVTMSEGTALLVLAGWLVLWLGLGAWRTRTMDA